MSKIKGNRMERELFHLLWEHFGAVVRVAGSGSTSKPAPDLLASNGERSVAIECKAVKSGRKYFDAKEIEELLYFSARFGAEAWIAVRYDNHGWWFVQAEKLERTAGEKFWVSLLFLEEQGQDFASFVKAKGI